MNRLINKKAQIFLFHCMMEVFWERFKSRVTMSRFNSKTLWKKKFNDDDETYLKYSPDVVLIFSSVAR